MLWGFVLLAVIIGISNRTLRKCLDELKEQGEQNRADLLQLHRRIDQITKAKSQLVTEKKESAQNFTTKKQVAPSEKVENNEKKDFAISPTKEKVERVSHADYFAQARLVEQAKIANQAAAPPNEVDVFLKKIWHKIWQWLVVGPEYVGANVTREFAFATQWLLRVGILIILAAGVYFARYSAERGLLVPPLRVALLVLLAVGLFVGAWRMLAGKYDLTARGMMGLSLVLFFLAAFVAQFYALLPWWAIFIFVLLVVAVGAMVAGKLNSLFIAFVAFIGGYGAIFLLRENFSSPLVVLIFINFISLAVLALVWQKNWQSLLFVAFCGAHLIIFSIISQLRIMPWWQGLLAISCLFVIFNFAIIVKNFLRQHKANIAPILLLFVNSFATLAWGFWLLENQLPRIYFACYCLFLATFFIIILAVGIGRKIYEPTLLACFMTLAAGFIALAIALYFATSVITLAWAILALMLIILAKKISNEFMALLGRVILALAQIRLIGYDLPQNYLQNSANHYWNDFFTRLLQIAVPLVAMFIASGKNFSNYITRAWHKKLIFAIFFVSIAVAFWVSSNEVWRLANEYFANFRHFALSLWWMVLLLGVFTRWDKSTATNNILLYSSLIFAALILLKIFAVDYVFWQEKEMFFGTQNYSLAMTSRIIAICLWLVLMIVFAWRWRIEQRVQMALAKWQILINIEFYLWLGIAILFSYSSWELTSAAHNFFADFQHGVLSIWWALIAISLLVVGVLYSLRSLRYGALILFAVVAVKVLVLDLAETAQIYRVIALTVVGVLAILAGVFYLKNRDKFNDS